MKASGIAFDIELVSGECHINGWVHDVSGVLKFCYERPESRDADQFLITTFARLLSIPKSRVTILKGAGSRFKRIKIGKDITFQELCNLLEAEKKQV